MAKCTICYRDKVKCKQDKCDVKACPKSTHDGGHVCLAKCTICYKEKVKCSGCDEQACPTAKHAAEHVCSAFKCAFCDHPLTLNEGVLRCGREECLETLESAVKTKFKKVLCTACNKVFVRGREICGWCVARKTFTQMRELVQGIANDAATKGTTPLGGKLACGLDKPNPSTPPPKIPKRIFLVPFKTKYDSAKDTDGKQKSAIEKLPPQLKREDGAIPLDSLQALLSYDLTRLDDVDSGLEFDVAHFYPTIDAQDSLEQIVAKLGQVKDKKIKIVLTADQRLATKTVKQGESYQLLFLPLACDRIVWLESGPFWNLVPRISASWTYPTAGAYYAEATETKKCFRMKESLPAGPAATLISRIDVPGEKLLEFSEQQFLLASPTAMNYKEVYGTLSLSWKAHTEKELPKKSVEVLNPDHPYALLSLLQKCKSCSKAPDVDESAYWPKTTLSEKLEQWAKGDAEYKSDKPTLKYKCISAASLPINVRAYLKAVTLAAQSERLVFPLDPHVGVLHTAHWDLLSLLPWKARDKRTAFEIKVATAFKNCTEIESVVEGEIPNSRAAHVVERRNPPWGEKAEGVAHTFPASMEVALPELGYASRAVILYEAPEVTVKRESEPARTAGAPLVFISAHYQAPTDTASSDEAQPHYLVVDIVEDPILNYCCKTGYAPAAGVLNDLLWFTPDELSVLKDIDKVRALCPYNWKPAPDNKQSLVECTDGYKKEGTELIKDLVDLIKATGHGREIFQDLFAPLTVDGGLSFAEPWLEKIEKDKWKFLPDCHISVRGGRGSINWKEDDSKELKNTLSQRYDLHVTLRAPWKGTGLSVGRMGIPTFYLYYRLFVNKSDGNIYLFPKGLDKDNASGSKLILAMCWRWAACNGISLNQLGFLEDRIEELNAETVRQERQSVASRAKNVK